MGGGRFIILENPAICRRCHKYLEAGRGAFWGSGRATCVPCVKKRGVVKMTAEEEALIEDKIREE